MWKIGGAVALAVAIPFGACRSGGTSRDARVRALAAKRLGVPAGEIRVTERTDLSFGGDVFLRATTRGDAPRTLTIVVRGDELVDATTPGAFDTIARAHDAARELDRLSPERVAGWFGALGGAGVCGEPITDMAEDAAADAGKLALAEASALPDGGRALSYRFANGSEIRRCVVELAPDGTARRVDTQAVPLAAR